MAYYALIMAGGGGTRLWPLSRRTHPKQALTLIGDRTLFRHAVDRIAPLFRPEQTFVVTVEGHLEQLIGQAPELPHGNFVVEPEGRGTGPCIGLSAIHLLRRDPDAIMAVLTADHFIANEDAFRNTLLAAVPLAEDGHLVTLGIQPSSPSTGLGYIKQKELLKTVDGLDVYRVARFTEKPDCETAVRMVASGEYSWNSGMFIWRADRILEEFRTQMGDFHERLAEVNGSLGTPEYEATLRRVWPGVGKQTIDYGIMERAIDVVVIPIDIGWSDVGSWASLAEILPADKTANTAIGRHVGFDTHNTLIFGGHRLVATIGLDNMVIVDTEDALLVCPKSRAQDVREIVRFLNREDQQEWL